LRELLEIRLTPERAFGVNFRIEASPEREVLGHEPMRRFDSLDGSHRPPRSPLWTGDGFGCEALLGSHDGATIFESTSRAGYATGRANEHRSPYAPTVSTPSERASEAAEVRIGYRLMGLAFQVTSEVVAGVAIGWFIDWMRGGGTTGLMIGGILGVAVAMFTLVRGGFKTMKELDAIDKRRKRGG